MARSGLIFNPASGLAAPDTSDIRAGLAADWSQAFAEPGLPALNTEPTTPAGQLIDALCAEIEAKNSELLFLASQFNPRISEGRWQDALGLIYFLKRKKDEPTVVLCQVNGLSGTVIPYGAIARSQEGHILLCNRSVSIGEDGSAQTTFRCVETGPIEIPAHAVSAIVTTIPGWDSIDNQEPGVTGRYLETRSDFEARRYASVAVNAHGSAAALYGALHNLGGEGGVLDVKVLENNGPEPVIQYGVTVPGHGVTICIFGGRDEDIARIIYEKKDGGCDTGGNTELTHIAQDYKGAVYNYKILRPDTVNFWVKVSLGAGSPLTPALSAAIKEAVYSDFLGENSHTRQARLGLASTVYASRFAHAVTALEQVKNLLGVSIALGNDPADYSPVLTISGAQEPVMTLDNIMVVQEHED